MVWWARWCCYGFLLVFLFYSVEDIRGALAWRDFLEKHPEFTYSKIAIPDSEEIEFKLQAGKDPPDPIGYYRNPDLLVDIDESRTMNYVFSGHYIPRSLEFPLPPFRRCGRWLPSSLLKKGTYIDEDAAAKIILNSGATFDDYHHGQDWDDSQTSPVFRAMTWRALAFLELGDNEASYQSLSRAISMIDDHDDGLSVSRSNDAAVDLMNCLQLIWQALKEEAFSPEKIEEIQARLLSIEYQKSAIHSATNYAKESSVEFDRYKWNLRERKSHTDFHFYGKPLGGLKEKIWGFLRSFLNAACIILMPNGWIDQNKVYFCEETLFAQTQFGNAVFSPCRFLAEARKFSGFHFDPAPTESFIRCGIVALAAEHFKIDQGTYPGSMEELVPKFLPEIMTDPYDPNQSLIYKVEKAHPVIYSIGPNLKDDGGTPRAPIAEGDLVWRYELPHGFTFHDYILH